MAGSTRWAEVEVFHFRHAQPFCHLARTCTTTIPTILAFVKAKQRLDVLGSHISDGGVPQPGSPRNDGIDCKGGLANVNVSTRIISGGADKPGSIRRPPPRMKWSAGRGPTSTLDNSCVSIPNSRLQGRLPMNAFISRITSSSFERKT
jgi:hypothetical protein